ncbi:MAG: ABC transporter permease [Azonexus sp.]|nr:ABC transporter permease [Betaproteobacteria bacterium]MBK8919000.1 ABC transporter permease [Betaproteobacteria bacterium]MBP6035815.1 ABC transporter permease [Azonexus sp.]MBP6905452.1 ABC transporter permease [Azonexus sp.]
MDAKNLLGDMQLAARNVLRHRRRALFALVIIVGGIVSFLLAGGFIQWLLISMRESTIHSQLGHIQVVRPGYYEVGISDPYAFLLPPGTEAEDAVRKAPGVVAVTPRLSLTGLVSMGDSTVSFIGDGVDPEGEKDLSTSIRIARGENLSADDPRGIIMGAGLAANIGVKVGDKLVLMTSTAKGGMNASDVTVRGIFISTAKAYDDAALRVPIALARKLVKVDGSTSWVVLLDDTARTDATLTALSGRMDPKEFQLVPWRDLADFYNKTVTLFSKQVLVVKILIAAIIVLSISNTMSMAVIERTGEIGTAMALGVRRLGVLRQFVLEGLVLGFVGGMTGALLGWLLSLAISAVGIPMPPPPGMDQGFDAEILVTADLAFDAWFLAVVTTLLASLFPAWKASRMVIVDALRHQR